MGNWFYIVVIIGGVIYIGLTALKAWKDKKKKKENEEKNGNGCISSTSKSNHDTSNGN